MNHKVGIHFGNFQLCTLKKFSMKCETNLFEQCFYYIFLLYIWLIAFIVGDLKLSHNRHNGEHNIMSSANPAICSCNYDAKVFIS